MSDEHASSTVPVSILDGIRGFSEPDDLAWKAVDPNKSLVLDSISFLLLVLDEMRDEKQSMDARSPYEKVFLDLALRHEARNPGIRQNALRMMLLAEDILLPPVDVQSRMFRDKVVTWAPSPGIALYNIPAESFTAIGHLCTTLATHPLASTMGMTVAESIGIAGEWARQRSFGQRNERSQLLQMLVAEACTAQIHARRASVPFASHGLFGWDFATPSPSSLNPDADHLVALWFENAVASPDPRSIGDALDLRENPRIQRWRAMMRSWQSQLVKGQTTKEAIVEQIRDANSYVLGGKSLGRLLHGWSTAVLVPLNFIATVFGVSWLSVGTLVIDGVVLYGKIVEAAVLSKEPLRYGWYLVDSK